MYTFTTSKKMIKMKRGKKMLNKLTNRKMKKKEQKKTE